MNPFDLGAEVFIVPVLWGLLTVTVLVLVIRSLGRTTTEAGAKWGVDRRRLRNSGLIFLSGGLLLASIVVVPPGHRGALYTTSGVSLTERQEGFSFMVPILHNTSMVNVREQVYENEEVYAQTADLLEVTMQVGVNYLITPDRAADIFRDVGQNYEAALIKPAVLDISKEQAGQIDALDFAKEREALANSITTGLVARLEPLGITVTFVAIEDAIFNADFVRAVLNKEIADEKATESLRLVQVALNEAQQVRERASGDADATALKGAGQQRAIEAVASALGFTPEQYLTWVHETRWNGILPQTLVTEGSADLLLGIE